MAFLSLLDYDSHYCVERTLKQSESEVTQLVAFVAENGTEQGPFVRKYLTVGQGIGSAYAEIFRAQHVALFWLLIVVASVESCFWPSLDMAEVNYPMWLCVVEYFVFMILSITCICYEVSDRRRVRRRIPMLAKLPLLLEFVVVALVAPFGLAVAMTLCYNAFAI